MNNSVFRVNENILHQNWWTLDNATHQVLMARLEEKEAQMQRWF